MSNQNTYCKTLLNKNNLKQNEFFSITNHLFLYISTLRKSKYFRTKRLQQSLQLGSLNNLIRGVRFEKSSNNADEINDLRSCEIYQKQERGRPWSCIFLQKQKL